MDELAIPGNSPHTFPVSSFRKLLRFAMITVLTVSTSAANAVNLTAICDGHHLPHAQHCHGADATDECAHEQAQTGDLGCRNHADGCDCIPADLATTEIARPTRPALARDRLSSPLPRGAGHLACQLRISLSGTGTVPADAAHLLARMSAHRTVVLRI